MHHARRFDGAPRMVSVLPENLLAELGVKPGENRDGVRFVQNMCPSKGTMDVFVEPVLPHPSLVILGGSPVALSLAAQARQLGYHVTVAAPAGDLTATPDADMLIDGFALGPLHEAKGAAKEKVGHAFNKPHLEAEGNAEKVGGRFKKGR